MKALILAAGTGTRLTGANDTGRPKSLLQFGGETLLARHIRILRALGIEELVIVVGYNEDQIRGEVTAIGADDFVRFVENPRFREGSVISMWSARDALTDGGDWLFMDADVLYDPAILERMVASDAATCFPYDSSFEDGEEPVKFCLKGGRPVEFRKAIGDVAYDDIGEWVGFIRMGPEFCAALADRTGAYVSDSPTPEPYEEAVRDLILGDFNDRVGAVDIAGLAWIEIDFPEDLIRAEQDILPRIGKPQYGTPQ
jgi:choline kinase